jgi:DeoR/GlpR family transcriptional regulator of sugar metabolism
MDLFPDCSSMTLRRDLIKLEEEGYIKRTRGGAVALNRLVHNVEELYIRRAMENIEAKKKIAQIAVKLIGTSRSLYLDGGSTVMCFAKELPDIHFSIVTGGINIAQELAQKSAHTVTVVGGQLNPNTLYCSGAQSIAFIENINIDVAILGTSGFSASSGFTNGSFTEYELKKAVMRKAQKTIMLMDSSKIDRSMPFTFATIADIDALVCDVTLSADVMAEAERCGTKVYTPEMMP